MEIGEPYNIIEKHPYIPNGECTWRGVISKIEPNFFEVDFCRTEEPWLISLIEKLKSEHKMSNSHRTFLKQTIRISTW